MVDLNYFFAQGPIGHIWSVNMHEHINNSFISVGTGETAAYTTTENAERSNDLWPLLL